MSSLIRLIHRHAYIFKLRKSLDFKCNSFSEREQNNFVVFCCFLLLHLSATLFFAFTQKYYQWWNVETKRKEEKDRDKQELKSVNWKMFLLNGCQFIACVRNRRYSLSMQINMRRRKNFNNKIYLNGSSQRCESIKCVRMQHSGRADEQWMILSRNLKHNDWIKYKQTRINRTSRAREFHLSIIIR